MGKFEYSSGETVPKLTLNFNNRAFYREKIVNGADVEFLKAFVRNSRNKKSNRLLAQSYLHLRQKIEQRTNSGQVLAEFVGEIVTAVDDTIQVIRITVKDDYDAYMLFETLNDRGLALSVADLLKNYLFSKAEEAIDDVQDNWQQTTESLGKIETKRYLRHLWLSKFGVVRDKDLYGRIKEKFRTKQQVYNFSKELRDSAESYAAFSDPQSAIWEIFDAQDRAKIVDHVEELMLFGVNQYNPLLLSAIEVRPEIFLSVVRSVSAFAFRYSIIMGSGTGNIERTFADAAVFVRNNPNCSAKDVFEKYRHLYPSDQDFRDAFSTKDVSHGALARYILRKINDKMEVGSGLVVDKNGFSMNLEHVLPQKFNRQDWTGFPDDVDPKDYVHRIGNMTLLSASINRKISNKGFGAKLAEFQKSDGLKISEDILSQQSWGAAEIDKRQIALAKAAADIWRVDY